MTQLLFLCDKFCCFLLGSCDVFIVLFPWNLAKALFSCSSSVAYDSWGSHLFIFLFSFILLVFGAYLSKVILLFWVLLFLLNIFVRFIDSFTWPCSNCWRFYGHSCTSPSCTWVYILAFNYVMVIFFTFISFYTPPERNCCSKRSAFSTLHLRKANICFFPKRLYQCTLSSAEYQHSCSFMCSQLLTFSDYIFDCLLGVKCIIGNICNSIVWMSCHFSKQEDSGAGHVSSFQFLKNNQSSVCLIAP